MRNSFPARFALREYISMFATFARHDENYPVNGLRRMTCAAMDRITPRKALGEDD